MVLFSSQELLQLEDRLGSVNRGAVQAIIERFTFPHKYKKVGLGESLSDKAPGKKYVEGNVKKRNGERQRCWARGLKERGWEWKEGHVLYSSSKVKLLFEK